MPLTGHTVLSDTSTCPAGLIAYWNFDDGTANDMLGINNGTVNGAPVWTSAGKLGGTYYFDGLDDYISVPDSDSLDFTTNFTISFWGKNMDCTDGWDSILAKEAWGSGTGWMISAVNYNPTWQQLEFFPNSDLYYTNLLDVNPNPLSGSTWAYITLTVNDTNMAYYVNGVMNKTIEKLPITANSVPLYIMRDHMGDFMAGSIDEVAIWNRALTATEISYLYNGGAGRDYCAAAPEEIPTCGSTPETTGITAYWKFDETNAGDVKDSIGASDGTNNGATINQQGKVNNAYSFDGINDYISVNSNTNINPSGDYTVSFWIYPTAWPTNTGPFSIGDSAAGANGLSMYVTGAGGNTNAIGSRDATSWENWVTATGYTPPLNQWSYVTITNDGSNFIFYIDGVQKGIDTSAAYINWASANWQDKSLYIGARKAQLGTYDKYLNGKIDEFIMYDKALSATDVETLYARSNSGNAYCEVEAPPASACPSDLIAYYKFDEGSGSVAADSTDNGYDGTINGATWTAGKVGTGALNFVAGNEVDTGEVINYNQFTISFWAKPNLVGPNYAYTINTGSGAGDYHPLISVGLSPPEPTYGGSIVSIGYPSNNEWYYFTVTYDGTTENLYLNDQLILSGAYTVPPAVNKILSIGGLANWGPAGEEYRGVMDEVAVYNRALTQAEVMENYNGGAGKDLCAAAVEIPECGTTPETTGIISYWKGDGNAEDSVNGNDGTAYGGATYSSGKVGSGAFSFDGTNYVKVNEASNLKISGPYTYTFWVYVNAYSPLSGPGYFGWFNQGNDPSGYNGISVIGSPSNDQVVFRGSASGAAWNNDARVSPINNYFPVGTWKHVAITNGGSNFIAYIDGVQVAIDNSAAFINWNSPNWLDGNLNIGRAESTGHNTYLNGKIDEFAVYNKALSAQEVSTLYDRSAAGGAYCNVSAAPPAPTCPSDMIAYWDFDDGTGNTASDYLNNNPGTLVNNPTWTTDAVAGKALDFEKDYRQSVNAGNSNIFNFGASDWTFSVWVKPESINSPTYNYFISKSYTDSIGPYAIGVLNEGTSNKWAFLASESPYIAWGINERFGNAPQVGAWQHIVVTRNGNLISHYVNGYKFPDTSIPFSLMSNTENFIIGDLNYPGMNLSFDGKIDEVAVFSRGFSQDDVNLIYGKGVNHTGVCGAAPEEISECGASGDATEGMVSYWKAENNANDEMNLNPGTLEGDATFAPGKVDQAFSLSGNPVDGSYVLNSYVLIGDKSSLEGFSQMTVAAWINPSSYPHYWNMIVSKGYDDGSAIPYDLALAPEDFYDSAGFGVWDGIWHLTGGTTEIYNDEWYFVVGTYDGANLNIYINGQLEGSLPHSGPIASNTANFIIGGGDWGPTYGMGYGFNGLIDEVAVFDSALSPVEVASLYARSLAGDHYCPYGGAGPVCTNGQVRACEKQQGVCAGSNEVCVNENWPGCNYLGIQGYEETEQSCDGIDNDCDGSVDEDVCGTTNYYCDSDEDGYISAGTTSSCSTYNCVPQGCQTSAGNDCNDNNDAVNPGAVEGTQATCWDGLDNNCNGLIDNADPECTIGAAQELPSCTLDEIFDLNGDSSINVQDIVHLQRWIAWNLLGRQGLEPELLGSAKGCELFSVQKNPQVVMQEQSLC